MLSPAYFAVLVLLAVPATCEEKLVGENGFPVLACQCKGKPHTHGHCGFHENILSSEDKPWCRTKHGCGHQSIRGAWAYCDARGLERRMLSDSKFYNVREVADFYKSDGKKKWADAEPYVERRVAANGKAYTVHEFRSYYIDALGEQGWLEKWMQGLPEKRTANDGKRYTLMEFVEYYGNSEGWKKWEAAHGTRDKL